MEFPFLGFGVGLRTTHYSHILEHWPQIDWFEIISENYMVDGGRPLYILEQVQERYPLVMHGVSLSIGSTDPLNKDYLKRLKKLADVVKPKWISDHLCFACTGGHNSHDLLPLPYTEEAITHVAKRIQQVQDHLGCQMLLENVSSYMEYKHSTMSEWEFLKAIVEEADCKTLLDINNIYVSSVNHSFDPMKFISAIPPDRVKQFHLAGHTEYETHLLDTHDHEIKSEVWKLYTKALERFGNISTLIEWDDHIPPFEELKSSADKAKKLYEAYAHARTNTETGVAAHL
ncbi:MAG: hypothetical protein A3I05_09060 [Deltaproteobacteria bacterium RIFCSPLOWO2_02_FULL_44_10]|nr:MAG: hypothetical protein A3C46_08555 [Deltaproteobacteria bacterium RIFCSPHIGHO2_02_FULL_44_16]OGQ45252.1 MAG: hypothetical protein A3I05_09060 [Deltaproteobacteria bacterium RIFCSPLOWO2_02_FULL_44_10]